MTNAERDTAPAAEPTDPSWQGTEHCCANCGASSQVVWCQAFDCWYCPFCRVWRTEKELAP